ncbi:MAG: hypothetical protein HYU66_27340 [Armatimonadetes bacterium]|nr:hypothetical protein [Armatimonadota bacterium]
MDDQQLLDEYWAIVEDCLTKLLECSEGDARLLVTRERSLLGSARQESFGLECHAEPFYTAYTLAHPEVDRRRRNRMADDALDRVESGYLRILAAHAQHIESERVSTRTHAG